MDYFLTVRDWNIISHRIAGTQYHLYNVKINFRSDLFNIYCDIVERKFELFETLTDIDDRARNDNSGSDGNGPSDDRPLS